MKNKNPIFFLILLGLLVRLSVFSLPGFKIDTDAWFAWAIRLNQTGFSNFYSNQVWTNYTPGFLYILYILDIIKNIFHLNDSIFYLILKLPSIVAEIGLGIFFYKFSKKSFWLLISVAIIFLNPAFIFNSSVWGQIDGLLTFFMFLFVYFLEKKKLILSSIFFGVAFLIKPQAIALLPVLGLYLIKNFSIKNSLRIILPSILVVFILSFPFFISQHWGLTQLFFKMFSDYPYTSLFAYNFWGIFGFWINDTDKWGFSYQNIGYIILICYFIFIAYLYFKKKLSLYSLAALSTISFFFLPTRVHERYLYPALIFLAILINYFKSKLLLFFVIILSLIHFLNLYFVYIYYNEIYLRLPKVLYNPLLYNFLNNNNKLLSLLSSLIFVIISGIIIKHEYNKT